MVKLGSLMPFIFSGDGNYCLKFHFNGLSAATLINMKTSENIKLTLTSSIWACDISESAEVIATVDEKCNYWVTDVKNNSTKKIMNLYTKLGLPSDKIDNLNMYLVDGASKILSFVHYSQYNPKEECQYIIITDINSGNSNILFNIADCFCSNTRKISDNELILFLHFRKSKSPDSLFSKNIYTLSKLRITNNDSILKHEYFKDFGINNWNFKHGNFSINNKFLPIIKLKGNLPSVYGKWCFLDYEAKKTLIDKEAFYYNKNLGGISWLPEENWFLCRFKGDDNYFIGDVLTGQKIAKITFEAFDVNVTRYYSNGKEKTITIANKKDFNFTNKSTPIAAIYTAGRHKEYLVFGSNKKEYAQDINVLLSFLKSSDQ